jgi:hypothetical protein
MNEQIEELAKQARLGPWVLRWDNLDLLTDLEQEQLEKIQKFAKLIVYDFLSELTNDDSLGEARIETIRRLARKWGVKE